MNFDDGSVEELIDGDNDSVFDAPTQGRVGCSHTVIGRRGLLKAGGLGLGMLMSGALLHKPLASAFAAFGRPRSAAPAIEVQVFQTAASLENLAVSTYAAALELPFVQESAVIVQFIETTMQQHSEHAALFNARAEGLGGARQEAPNPKYSRFVEESMPSVADVAGVVALAATLEEAATDTYLSNLTMLRDATMRTLMAGVMGVESQHLAILRTFGALIAAGVPELVAIPTDLSALPMVVGSVAFPLALELPNFASGPAEGAVR